MKCFLTFYLLVACITTTRAQNGKIISKTNYSFPDSDILEIKKIYPDFDSITALRQPVKFILYPGGDHGLRAYRKSVNEEIRKWFDDYLKNGKPLPDMEKHGN